MPAKGFRKQFCKRNHDLSLPDAKNKAGRCKLCIKEKEYQKKWRLANPERNKEIAKRASDKQRKINPNLDKEKYLANRDYYQQRYRDNKTELLAQNKEYHTTIAGKFSRLKAKAKSRKINFELTLEQYTEVIFKSCHYCNADLVSITGGCIDRIDNDKVIGYRIDNVLPCCPSCNALRNRLHTVEETLVMVHMLKAVRKFPILIEILKKKDIGFVKSPFIGEDSWYPNRGKLRKSDLKPIARFKALVGRQKIENIVVSLSFDDYRNLILQPCFYCSSSLAYSKGRGLDQINPVGEYRVDNVLPCCFVCNTIRNNRFTVDETKIMVIVRNLFRKKFLQEK
jgi:hypothetical protein